jgi:predicted small metal-binding protein
MAKYYYIDCHEVGYLDCDFCTTAESVELVVEQCAEHGREHHALKGFGLELFAKMRPYIRVRDTLDPMHNAPLG